jgi:hypothetical protein
MRLVSFGVCASASRPRLARSRKTEEIMRIWTLNELDRLTLSELFELQDELVAALACEPDDSPERAVMLGNLDLVRRALMRRVLQLGRGVGAPAP